MAGRSRKLRPRLRSEVPLDDGAREGTDPWCNVDGVTFCHWDRWLLRLALEEPEGLRSIAREFRSRARARDGTRDVAEAMLAQLADLEARALTLGRTPAELLDDVERASKWLRDKAFRRVWHATSMRSRTAAMERTPRKVFAARAREGNWSAFPVSPAGHFAKLHAIYRHGYYDYRGVGSVVLLLQTEGDRRLATATSRDEELAVRRAIVGAAIEAMAHVDDSSGDLGDYFRDQEKAYLEHLLPYVEQPGILRDLLELATWEDYGLFEQVETFLTRLPERAADLAVRELARIISELRAAELEYQHDKAQSLRAAVLRSAEHCDEAASGEPQARSASPVDV